MTSPSPQRPPPRARSSSGSTAPTALEPIPIPYTPKCTTDEYIKAIAYHSQQSSANTLYPGDIYHTLHRFLEPRSPCGPGAGNHASSDFAWLVSPGQQTAASDNQSVSESLRYPMADGQRNQGRSEGFSDPESCIEALRSNIEISHPQVLFLRGHLSPSWLSSLGAFCYVDPELFRCFSRYRAPPGSDCYFGSAPPAMSRIFRFKIYTIGFNNYRYRSSQKELDALRAKAADDFQRYQTNLQSGWALKPGDSIVRNFHVLDEQHCVVEQEIVISIFDIGKTWMAIACTDAGHDLTQGPPLPWLGDGGAEPLPTTLVPIIQYRPRCALKSRIIPQRKEGGNYRQSLAVFPEGYGRSLDWASAKSDRFPVLSELFKLSAFSQKQLLNLIQEKITAETNRRSTEKPTLANLLYYRDILQDQLSDISQSLLLTNAQTKILHNTPSRRPAAVQHALDEVHSLFVDLHSQAQSLHERCSQGMTVISNNSMLEESQRAIQQAKLVTKLTLVAFVYLPFTFTAGFFGMNMRELEASQIPLWVYFATSLPLTLVTMMFFVLDVSSVKGFLRTLEVGRRSEG